MNTTRPGRLDRVLGIKVQYALGRALERIGAPDEARQAYLAVLIIDGSHEDARRRWRALSVAQHPTVAAADVAQAVPAFTAEILVPSGVSPESAPATIVL
jgi:hypothetical protein